MTVYFARGSENGLVKIGYTKLPIQKRLYALRAAFKQEFQLLRTIESAACWHERWFHRKFAGHHVEREWFLFDDSMMTVEPPVRPVPRVKVDHTRWDAVFEIGKLIGIKDYNLRNWLRNNHVPRRLVPQFLDMAEKLGLPLSREVLSDLRGKGNAHPYTASAFGYIGVTSRRRTGKFVARLVIDKTLLQVGVFDTAEEAARAHDMAARHVHGKNALTNFQDGHDAGLLDLKKFALRCDKIRARERNGESQQ